MDLVEGVVSTDEVWATLRAAVAGAARKSQLRVVEDQVDAVLCAYVVWYADRHPDRVTAYGDDETGIIVTPSLGLPAATTRHDPAREAVRSYAEQHPDLVAAASAAVALLASILDEAGINYLTIEGRAKSVASFAEKATRTASGRAMYADPLADIGDQLGVRVITYVRDDVEAVAALLAEQLPVLDDRDFGELTASQGRFGYASRHLQVEIEGRVVQVQLRTVLQHAWAEFEHDIRYKGTVPVEHASEFDRRFTLAAGLLELADQEFSAIRERLRGAAPTETAGDDPRIAPGELAAFLAGQYADAGWSRTDHYAWISGLLLELGITTLVELAELLRATDEAAIGARMDYRYPPGAVRRLDDALLSAFGERYVALHGNAHRRDLLATRLERLRGAPTAT
jgi:ppGpp synthetase/RelA/SpoT-type nucleotidyltranferase